VAGGEPVGRRRGGGGIDARLAAGAGAGVPAGAAARRAAAGARHLGGAQKLGLNERTLKRAKKELGIRSEKGLLNGVQHYYWIEAGQGLPAELRIPSAADDLEEWLAPLRAKYPPSTPLDED